MIKLAVLMGGTSGERDVSIMSGNEIIKCLDKKKYDVNVIEITDTNAKEWVRALIDNTPDVVLSALHGGIGENGAVQGLMECLGIPYVGSKVMASAVGMDKAMSKLIMRACHIPVAEDILIKKGERLTAYEADINKLGFPLVVKPNNGGSSIGVTIVNTEDELIKAAAVVEAMDDDLLIEQYISGHEVTCGIVESVDGLEVLTVLDIAAQNEFYDYEAKYFDDSTKIDFSELPEFLQVMIQDIAKKVFVVLGCSGYGRVDMIVRDEQIYVLEINTLPGLTSHSLVPKAASKNYDSFGMLLDKLIGFELGKAKGY